MTNTLSDKIKPLIQTTEDGSHTLFVSEINESYHSLFGAIQESKYIFIDAALKFSGKKELSILEVGFGTGLNAFLTYVEAANRGLFVDYTTIEKFPVAFEEAIKLNYPEKVSPENRAVFNFLHFWQWNQPVQITENFVFEKIQADFTGYHHKSTYDIIYFDAFSPEKQPEMWTQELFEKLYDQCNPGAILTTYCAKGEVRRRLISAGFSVERLPGPPGKRQILRAIKM